MEIIHCFNFIMLFFALVVGVGNLVYSIQISIALTKIFDFLKKWRRELENEAEEDLKPESKEPVLNVGNYAVAAINYDDE